MREIIVLIKINHGLALNLLMQDLSNADNNHAGGYACTRHSTEMPAPFGLFCAAAMGHAALSKSSEPFIRLGPP